MDETDKELLGEYPEEFREGVLEDYKSWCSKFGRSPSFSEWSTYALTEQDCPNVFAAIRRLQRCAW